MSHYQAFLDQLKQNDDVIQDFVTKASAYFATLRASLCAALGCTDGDLALELPASHLEGEQPRSAVSVLGPLGLRTMFVLKVPDGDIGISVMIIPSRQS